jgi:hypothetical protein
MRGYKPETWARAAREIEHACRMFGNLLKQLDALEPSGPTIHIYSQLRDDGYLDVQM